MNKYFFFSRDWYDAVRDFSDAERLEVYDAIMAKVFGEQQEQCLSENVKLALRFIFPVLERNLRKQEQRG